MSEKTLEKVTGLSRRQIIMLQKTCIKRKNKIVVGLSYDYSDDEVLEFMLAKVFKDCGYSYPEIKVLMDRFRNKDLIILEDEFKSASDRLIVITDDGSNGLKGNVTMPLKEILDKENDIDMIIAIGPLIMMKFVTLTAKEYNVPVTVSMNPIMIDGTGMCGGCRLSLNKDGKKEIKFACIDGPDFNGYEIDFDEAISRSSEYKEFERKSYDEACNLMTKEVK